MPQMKNTTNTNHYCSDCGDVIRPGAMYHVNLVKRTKHCTACGELGPLTNNTPQVSNEEKADTPTATAPQVNPTPVTNSTPVTNPAPVPTPITAYDPLTQAVIGVIDRTVEPKLEALKQEVASMQVVISKTVQLDVPSMELSVKTTNPHLPKLLACVTAKMRPWLHGPAGSGKSTLAMELAKALGYEFVSISLSAGSTKSEATGFIDATGKYQASKLYSAVKNGNTVLLLDEFDNCSGNLSTVLNTGLANFVWDFPHEQVREHETCIILIATNTNMRGNDFLYPERETHGAATISRFVYIHLPYDEKAELEWSLAYAKHPDMALTITKWVQSVQACRKLATDKRLRVVISPRASVYGAKLIATGFPFTSDELFESLIAQGCDAAIASQLRGAL